MRKPPKKDPDTQSESGFKISNFNLQRLSSFYDKRRSRANSININNAPGMENVQVEELGPLEGVMFFINDSNGVCGRLTICTKQGTLEFTSMDFEQPPPPETPTTPTKALLKRTLARNPLEDINSDHYVLDFFNILDIEKEINRERHDVVLHIFCQNFRYVKFLIRASEKAQLFVQFILNLSLGTKRFASNAGEPAETSSNTTNTFTASNSNGGGSHSSTYVESLFNNFRHSLWQYLRRTYPYETATDWKRLESWFIENYRIRFFINDIHLMPTMPLTFIVPQRMSDGEVTRILSLSSAAARVPVISYMHRKSNHLLLRSSTFNEHSVHSLLAKYVTPLKEVPVANWLPSLAKVAKYYQQIRAQSYAVTRRNNNPSLVTCHTIGRSKHFWSKCADWLTLVSRVLTFINHQLVTVFLNEGSVVLVEANDAGWDCLLAALVQIIVDPSCRKINGFECLLSKEWIHLAGYKAAQDKQGKLKVVNVPDVALFHLFLDCVHQLMIQHPTQFEFTTFYLLALVDVQFAGDWGGPGPGGSAHNRHKSRQFEADKEHELMHNPFYWDQTETDADDTTDRLQLKTSVHDVELFYALFLRHLKSDVGKFTPEEQLYVMELKNSGHL